MSPARSQAELLTTALGLLRPGGRLVYSVCALEPVTSGLRWNLDGSEAMALGFGTLQSTSNIVEPVCVDEHGRGHVRVRCNGPLLWTTELKGSDKS